MYSRTLSTWIVGWSYLLIASNAYSGEVYSYSKLQKIATAFIDTYDDLIHNQSASTNTEMLILSSEYKGYVGSYLDFEQRDQDLSKGLIKRCLMHATLEEIALNVAYLVLDLKPLKDIGSSENFALAVQAYCQRQVPANAKMAI